uniref:Uncharacterized protein n=1 Tax=Steinernema glaseri TaxID=37863 RepID=A0A1I8A183_9BILA
MCGSLLYTEEGAEGEEGKERANLEEKVAINQKDCKKSSSGRSVIYSSRSALDQELCHVSLISLTLSHQTALTRRSCKNEAFGAVGCPRKGPIGWPALVNNPSGGGHWSEKRRLARSQRAYANERAKVDEEGSIARSERAIRRPYVGGRRMAVEPRGACRGMGLLTVPGLLAEVRGEADQRGDKGEGIHSASGTPMVAFWPMIAGDPYRRLWYSNNPGLTAIKAA